MNAIKDTLQGLVRRRLWPVAALLLGALVAVPMVLAKSPQAVPAAPVHTTKEDIGSSYVALADSADTTKRRRVLGAAKDPFEPKALPKAKKTKKAKADATATPEATPTATAAPDKGASAPTSGGTTVPPTSSAPATPTETVPAYAIKVRFGTTESGDLTQDTVERMSVLPDEDNPLLVYRGVEDGGKVAVFELTGDIDAEGDGRCSPTPEDCQYLKLRAGETEFITISGTGTVADAQYQLDLVKIYKRKTKVKATGDDSQPLAKGASSSLKTEKVALRRRNRYVFDATTGTLRLAKKGAKTPVSSL